VKLFHHPREFSISWISFERDDGIAAVVLDEIRLIVHGVVHAHGWRCEFRVTSEDEILHPEKLCGRGSLAGPGARPQVDVVASGGELDENLAGVRTRDASVE
jgi:hypothetical protein